MLRTLFAVSALLLLAAPSQAQEVAPPPIVTDGLKALVSSGIDSATAVWFRGSGLEGDTAAAGTIARAFASIPPSFGKPIGFEILKTFTLGTHLRRSYAIVLFEGGPIYLKFHYYLGPNGWLLQHFDFNTDAEKVLPASLALP